MTICRFASRAEGRALASCAALSLCILLAACSSPPKGYGVSTRNIPPPSSMDANEDNTTTAEKTRDTYLDLIRQMQVQGLWFASLAHIDAFELSYGGSVESNLLRADALRNAGKIDEAIAIYRKLTDGPQGSRAYRGLGLAAGARQDFAGAASYFQLAQRRNPTDASILSDLAYAQMRAGQMDAAWVPIMQAAQLAPRDPRVQSNLALFYYVQGDESRAEQVLGAMVNSDDSTREALRRTAMQVRQKMAPTSIPDNGRATSSRINPQQPGSLLVRRTVAAPVGAASAESLALQPSTGLSARDRIDGASTGTVGP